MYDLIGDIHGHADELKNLLHKLEYKEINGSWQHHNRKVIFVGDYIDRGPKIREVLQIVKGMTDMGSAIALMGNHEYNALAYNYKYKGAFLRPHTDKNTHQHIETINQFKDYPDEWKLYTKWFYSLSLFLELPELNAVHACWNVSDIEWLKQENHYKMSEQLLLESHQKGSLAYNVINDTLKGKEINIPAEFAWHDKDGNLRTENRYKWWIDTKGATYEECIFNCPDTIKGNIISPDIKVSVYPKEYPPVFFGHYWLEDKTPSIQSGNVVCLDYSIAKQGNLVAYSYNGEALVDDRNFVFVTYGKV